MALTDPEKKVRKKRVTSGELCKRSKEHMEKTRNVKLCERTERWNTFAQVHNDLFGILDMVAVGNGKTYGIQVTSRSNMADRERKVKESDPYPILREAGWVLLLHGWDKFDGKWRVKEVYL